VNNAVRKIKVTISIQCNDLMPHIPIIFPVKFLEYRREDGTIVQEKKTGSLINK
jgi:hypothetical protein